MRLITSKVITSRVQIGRHAVFSRGEDLALLMGRLFVAALFLPSGFHKLMTFSIYSASLKAKGLPFPLVWAVVLVAAEVLGPLALIIGAWPRWTALALVALWARCFGLGRMRNFTARWPSWVACCSTSRADQEPGVGEAVPIVVQKPNPYKTLE
jgi:DoxX